MPFNFDDAVHVLGMDDRTTDDVTPWVDHGPQEMPADERGWELRVYSNRPVFNLARIVKEIDPEYEVEVIER